MENKYQEALENAKKCCCWCDEYCKTKIDEYNKNYEGFETLQELIDNYSNLEKENKHLKFNTQINHNMNDIHFEEKQCYKQKIKLLEKALDKACEKMFFSRIFDGMKPRDIEEYYLKQAKKELESEKQ